MRLIGPYNEQVAGMKRQHIIANQQCAFPVYYPGNLDFIMTMQMTIKIRQSILLNMD
jgi:hypothetical protein